MMKQCSLWIAALFLMSGMSVAQANHHEPGDTAQDEKCEGMTHGDFSITYLDADQDGVITKQEYLAGDANNTEKTFLHIDANQDGQLDLDEQKQIEMVYQDIHQKYKRTTI